MLPILRLAAALAVLAASSRLTTRSIGLTTTSELGLRSSDEAAGGSVGDR